MEDLFKSAADYAARGWRTLRIYGLKPDGKTCSCRNGYSCGTPGKHPVDRDWQNSATTDEDTVEAWFADVTDGMNIGVLYAGNRPCYELDYGRAPKSVADLEMEFRV